MKTGLVNLETKVNFVEGKLNKCADTKICSTDSGNTEAVPDLRVILNEEVQQLRVKMEENEKRLREELGAKQEQQLAQQKDVKATKNNAVIYGVPESREQDYRKRWEEALGFIVWMETMELYMQNTCMKM